MYVVIAVEGYSVFYWSEVGQIVEEDSRVSPVNFLLWKMPLHPVLAHRTRILIVMEL